MKGYPIFSLGPLVLCIGKLRLEFFLLGEPPLFCIRVIGSRYKIQQYTVYVL
jgi:hypothetical protein